ncbi:DUF937 domain-containing protein [Mesorhizobium sp. KR1-2]|uniref:DUF937 domain-containing protein n=1 Tax=Mesorhizobium sp. KR1-2 TaxID=3156609 RepID=UPI0032B5588E
MLPLFDMLNNAQNGKGMEALARQFDLSMQQTQAAVEALLPAFSQGLKQNTADPYGVGAFLNAMASGQHAKYFDDPSNAFSPAGMAEGNGILGHLFGSKELSKAVADQAAVASGVSQEVLKQMLPVLASMIMGGLSRQTAAQFQAGSSAVNNPLALMFEQMMRQAGTMPGGTAQPSQSTGATDNPFGPMLQAIFGGAQQPGPASNAPMDNPWGKFFEQMFGGARPAPEPPTNPSGRPRTPYDDLFGKMFETGARQRDEYQKSIETIFEQFAKDMHRYR